MNSLDSVDSPWGVTVSQYLAAGPRYRLSEQIKMIHDQSANRVTQTSMEGFLAPTTDITPLSSLIDLLLLAQSPKGLSGFCNTGIIPACMRVLKQYVQDYNKAFDRTYGLLCLDLLSITIQVGILAQCDRFRSLIKTLGAKKLHGPEVISKLEDETAKSISNALCAQDPHSELRRILGWNHNQTFFPLCGGLNKNNIRFVLDLLAEDESTFLRLGLSCLAPRYLSIVFVLWQGLCSLEVRGNVTKATWAQLYSLVHRYHLYAPSSEVLILQKIGFHVEGKKDEGSQRWSDGKLDAVDSRRIIQAYIDLLNSNISNAERLPIIFATCFYDFAFHSFTEEIEDLAPGLVEASMIRLWAEFEDNGPMLPRITWVVRYAAHTFQWAEFLRDEITEQKHRTKFAQVLFDQDFVDLAARCLLLTTTEEIGYPANKNLLDGLAQDWEFLIQSIILFCTEEEGPLLVPSGLFGPVIPEIFKTLAHQSSLVAEFEPGTPRGHLYGVWVALGRLADSIGHGRGNCARQCQSPRCPNPTFHTGGVQYQCSRCQHAAYCSPRCQATHFLLDTPDSHKLQCYSFD